MRILIAGAGATGGYFGARLIQAERDVTFLVRPRRAEQLRDGLCLVGPGGEETVPVAIVTVEALGGTYDLVIVAVKAGALPDVIGQIAPAMGPETMVLPFLNGMAHLLNGMAHLLNGMAHLQALTDRFGPARVLGGIVKVVATVADDGAIHQMHPIATLTLSPPSGQITDRIRRIHRELSVSGMEASIAEDVVGAMWHKWAFITAAGVITCLMRAPIGDIVAAPTANTSSALSSPRPSRSPRPPAIRCPSLSTMPWWACSAHQVQGSGFTSSLYRDVTAGLPHEGEHLLGAFIATAAGLGVDIPLTALALLQLRAHDHATA